MNPTTTEQPAATPLSTAVNAVDAAVEDLIKTVEADALSGVGAFSLVELLQRIETVRNKLPSVDRAMIQYGTEQGVPSVLSCRTMRQVLTGSLRLSPGEANRRVKAAGQLADRHSMLGEPLPPLRPHLAAAQRAGLVTPEQVSLIDTALGKVKHCDPDAVEAGEIFLVEHAAKLGYQDLDRAAAKLVEAIDPDGILPSDEAEHRLRRFFHLKQRKDGSWAGDFRLTPEVGQKLAALLGPLMKPQTTTAQPRRHRDGQAGARSRSSTDERTQGQRRHDALEDIIDRTLNAGDLPASGGTPTTLIITMSWQDFTTVRGGIGAYADGSPVSAATARRLADQAEVAFCLKSDEGCGAGPVPDPPDRHPDADVGVDRPGRRMLASRAARWHRSGANGIM